MAKLSFIAVLAASAALMFASAADATPVRAGARLNFGFAEAPVRHQRRVDGEVRALTRAPVSAFGPVNPVQAALDYVQEHLAASGSPFTDYVVRDSYKTKHNGVSHVYLRQVINGLEVVNADINVNVLSDGTVLSMGDSFFTGKSAPAVANGFAAADAKVSALDALKSFAAFIGKDVEPARGFAAFGAEPVVVKPIDETQSLIENVAFAVSSVPAKMVYIHNGEEVRLGWELTVEMEDNWFNTVVDAADGEIIAVSDWVSDSKFNAYPQNVNDPEDGERQLFVDPEDKKSSPLGWNDAGKGTIQVTTGNNVDAYGPSSKRPSGGAALNFDFPVDLNKDPNTYVEGAVTQLFFTINELHDTLYYYGFDEVSGNFQASNFNKGGKGNDAVAASAQDASGTNNANFATPPDGQPGKMRMYVWTASTPKRDGDLEAGIVVHENMHGVSTRLTGGPANSNCLGSGEAGGMGEGWGDFVATLIRQRKNNLATVYPMGAYSANKVKGIRNYAYSVDMSVNPSMYSFIKKSGYSGVHAKGEVWA